MDENQFVGESNESLVTEGTFVGTVSNDSVPYREIKVSASDRREAVEQITRIFWKEKLGNAKTDLIISDPAEEVRYDEDMKCTDTLYRYLSEDVLQKVIAESQGVLVQNPKYPNSGCQLRRTKVRDYKKLEREGKTVRSSKLLVSPALISAIDLISKNNKPAPEINVWSGKDYSSESKGPTIVSPWKPHAKDGDKTRLLGIPLRDVGLYKPKNQ